MLYLRTGANGSCKTLFTLWDVRKLQLETNRPVCINGRFKIKPEKLAEFGWRVIEFKDWEDQPDGTIFLIDECHNDMPLRSNKNAR
jgi:zona occludens toxin